VQHAAQVGFVNRSAQANARSADVDLDDAFGPPEGRRVLTTMAVLDMSG
jgi:hypothetical protein